MQLTRRQNANGHFDRLIAVFVPKRCINLCVNKLSSTRHCAIWIFPVGGLRYIDRGAELSVGAGTSCYTDAGCLIQTQTYRLTIGTLHPVSPRY